MSLKTRSGQPKLSEVAKHLVLPEGIVSTGWPAVKDKLDEFGVTFDRWQEGIATATLAKRRMDSMRLPLVVSPGLFRDRWARLSRSDISSSRFVY